MMTNYNIGFTKWHVGRQKYIASCGCGTIGLLGKYRTSVHTCEKCGNTTFVLMESSQRRVIHPHLEVLESNRKGFKVKRTNVSVFYDDDFNVFNKNNMVREFIYDLADKKIKMFKNGVDLETHPYNYDAEITRFLTSIDNVTFKNIISTEETKWLYDFAYQSLSRQNRWGSVRKFSLGLVSLLNSYSYMQVLNNAGYPNVNRFFEDRRYTHRSNWVINSEGTNPRDILGLPKFILQYIKDGTDIDVHDISQIQKALKKVDGNRFRELMEIVKDESSIRELCRCIDTVVEIHDTYKYNNLKRLALYLFREIRMNQGISSPTEGTRLLRDYINMSTKLEQEYDKYPKSLKKEHDITSMNYKVQENAIKIKQFTTAVNDEEYKLYEWKKKEFAIITPTEMRDLVKEGSDLSHCVASYVDSIIEKRCKIFFLRKSDDLESSLATVEVRGTNVRQAKGYANRSLSTKERDFITEWAKKKELHLNYY